MLIIVTKLKHIKKKFFKCNEDVPIDKAYFPKFNIFQYAYSRNILNQEGLLIQGGLRYNIKCYTI